MANNDIHYIRRELDQLQIRMKDFDVRTEYALSNSDTTPPPNDAEWSTEKPAPEEGKFIWARNIMNMGYGDVITEAYCIGDGQEHILSIDVEYLAWNSPYRQDGDGMEDSPYWQTVAPSILPNQYIWTRSVIETTNGTNYTSPVRITGLKGEKGQDGTNGIDGKAGKDGKGLEFIFKRLSTKVDNWNNPPSGVINPATLPAQETTDDYVPTGWTDDQEEVTEALPFQYVSIRTKTIATGQTDGKWQRFNTPRLWSVYGEKPYCHIRYADVNNPTNWNQTFANPQTSGATGISYHKYEGYLWNADETLKDADKDPTKFSWRIYRPTIGVAGEEGSFLHIAYADDEQGTGFNQYEGAYMGTCITWEETDPDDPSLYNWVKIEGNGIDYIEEQYALHTSYSTAPTTGWQSTKPTYVLGKYYWTRSVIHYTDGTSEQSAPMCVTGLDGTGINNVFYCTDDLSTPSTPTWSDVHDNSSTMSRNYDKWVKDPVPVSAYHRYIYVSSSTTHAYTNGVKSWTNFSAPALWGRYASDGTNGVDGTDGLGIYSISSTITINSWSSLDYPDGKYITAKTPIETELGKSLSVGEHIIYRNYMYEILVVGATNYGLSDRILLKGEAGSDGSGYEYAYKTTNTQIQPSDKPTGDVTNTTGHDWSKVPVPMTSTYKYMYISYRTITGSTKSAWSNSALWSQFGEKGDTGDRGVDGKGLEHIFYRSNTKMTWGNNNTNPAYWNAKQEDDYYGQDISGNQWTDDAQGVDKDHKYEYCAIRTKTPNSSGIGQWSKFNTPVLQNIYSAPITQVINYYLATSSTTAPSKTPTTNWATSPTDNKAKMTATNQYLWNYEVIMDIDNNVVNSSNPCMIGRYGQNGSAGKGIDSITEYYAVNNNKEEIPEDSSFSTNVITTTTSNRYLWNYEVITFSDSSTPYKSSKRIISTHGATGQNGSDGEDGFGVYRIFSTITINTWSSASYPTGRYITARSPIEAELGTVLNVGDHLIYGDYMYEIVARGDNPTTGNYGLSDRVLLKGDDGDGHQIIYCVTQRENVPSTPTDSTVIHHEGDDINDGLWFDVPIAPSDVYSYCWQSQKTFIDGVWGNYQTPVRYNYYTRDGMNGDKGDKGEKGRDGTELTGDEIMMKIAGQNIDAQTVGGLNPADLLTTDIQDSGVIYDSNNHGYYRVLRNGRIVIFALLDYQWTAQTTATLQTIFTLPTWAYPLMNQYGMSVPHGETLSITSGGDVRCTPTTTGLHQLSGSFAYIADLNTKIQTNITVNTTTVTTGDSIQITLTGNNVNLKNTPIKIQVSGQTYTRTTDQNGVVDWNINLNAGTYAVTIRWEGNSTYAPFTKNITLTVNRASSVVIYSENNHSAKITKTIRDGEPVRDLLCEVNIGGYIFYQSTDYYGILDFTSVLKNYKGNVIATITTMNTNKCPTTVGGVTLTGTRQTQDYKRYYSPTSVSGDLNGSSNWGEKSGTWWNYATTGSFGERNDGAYAITDILSSSSTAGNLDVQFTPNLETGAIVKKVTVYVRFASLQGWTSASKGSYDAGQSKIIVQNGSGGSLTGISEQNFVRNNIVRTDCGKWYELAYSWENLNIAKSTLGNPKVHISGIKNGGGGYSNNSRFGIDFVQLILEYEA